MEGLEQEATGVDLSCNEVVSDYEALSISICQVSLGRDRLVLNGCPITQ